MLTFDLHAGHDGAYPAGDKGANTVCDALSSGKQSSTAKSARSTLNARPGWLLLDINAAG